MLHPPLRLCLSALFVCFAAGFGQTYSFDDGKLPATWAVESGTWKVENGALQTNASRGLGVIFFGDPNQQNYEFSARVCFEAVNNDSRWLALAFRADSEGEAHWSQVPVRFNTVKGNGIEFAVRNGGEWNVRSTSRAQKAFELGRSRMLRVVVRGALVRGYLDGERLIRSSFCIDRDKGRLGLVAAGCTAIFDDVTVKPLPASGKDNSPLPPQRCAVVAHRGYSAMAPENTLSSIRAAIEVGADGCEIDVRLSKDGQLVLLHDATLERTTNGTGKVEERTLAELKALDAGGWKKAKFAGERIPTLEEALVVLKDSGCIPVVEIKVGGISKKVVETLRRLDMVGQAAVIAFNGRVVNEIRKLEPKLPCYWLRHKTIDGTEEEQAATIFREAAKLDTNRVDLHYGMLSPGVVSGLKFRGVKLWCWTVNNPVEMDALMRWGVDAITTDSPDRAVRLNKECQSR